MKKIKPQLLTQLRKEFMWIVIIRRFKLFPTKKVEVYHKGKLVPGVEIFPYINVLKPILGNAMINLGGTTASLASDPERKVFRKPLQPKEN